MTNRISTMNDFETQFNPSDYEKRDETDTGMSEQVPALGGASIGPLVELEIVSLAESGVSLEPSTINSTQTRPVSYEVLSPSQQEGDGTCGASCAVCSGKNC